MLLYLPYLLKHGTQVPSPPFQEAGTIPFVRVSTLSVTRPCHLEPAPLQQVLPAKDLWIALDIDKENFFFIECHSQVKFHTLHRPPVIINKFMDLKKINKSLLVP